MTTSRHFALFRKGRLEQELDEELHFHLEMLVEENFRKGMSWEEARYAARRSFGGVEQVREVYRDQGSLPMIETLMQDIRYALRQLRRSPGFATAAVLILALGIGARTAIFTIINGVMLRPLPYHDADRIMLLAERTRSGEIFSVSWPNFQDWRDQNRVFENLGIYRQINVNLTGVEPPERLMGSMASSGVFAALGLPPLVGRVFSAAEDRPGTDRVALISERLWRGRFGGDGTLVGRQIRLGDESFAIVGIMPSTTRFPSRQTDVWLSLGAFVDRLPQSRDSHPNLWAVGRLKEGISASQAVAEMDTIARCSLQ